MFHYQVGVEGELRNAPMFDWDMIYRILVGLFGA